MKKKNLILAIAAIICGLSAFLFNACDKDTNCYVKVTVIDEVTKAPVPNAFVKIDIDSSYVNAQGRTDQNGVFNATFSAPAIFNVVAVLETGYDSVFTPDFYYCYRTGNNTIRLQEGDTVFSTVVLESFIHQQLR